MSGDNNILKNIKDRLIKAGPATGQDIIETTLSLASLFLTLVIYLVASVLIGFVVYKILAVGGIEAVLAQLMAAACVNNSGVPCDFNTLLAGTGLTLVILAGAAIAIMRETLKIENVPFYDDLTQDLGPCKNYNSEMTEVLNTIQKLGGVENLHGLAAWKGIPYTTMRNYITTFENDGYVKVNSTGKGAPVRIDLQ